MANPVFENKIKKWEQSRLAVRNSIANYAEQHEYFSELEQMAFTSTLKKREMEERLQPLKTFALGIASIKPDLAASLNIFLPLCQTLYGDAEFKRMARTLGVAAQLMHTTEEEEERTKRINDQNKQKAEKERRQTNAKQIIEKDVREWNDLRNALPTALTEYEVMLDPFIITMFNLSGHLDIDKQSDHIRKMQLFANQISGKDSHFGSQLQKYAALSNKYLQDEAKLKLFRSTLRQKGYYEEIDRFYQTMHRQRSQDQADERAKQQKLAEEQERKRRMAEEQEKKRKEAERARKQKQEAENREREKQRKIKAEKARKAKKTFSMLFFVAIAVGIAWVGIKFYKNQRQENMFDNQIRVGDKKLASKDYRSAIEEYRKAVSIDSDKGSFVTQKILDTENMASEEFSILSKELKTILKADRNIFNEDSDKRLNRMLEIRPDDSECKQYQEKRERQLAKTKRY